MTIDHFREKKYNDINEIKMRICCARMISQQAGLSHLIALNEQKAEKLGK
jgi:hypothetical protein